MCLTKMSRVNIIDTWSALQKGTSCGLLKRLIKDDSKYLLYGLYDSISKSFGLGISYPTTIDISIEEIKKFKNLSVIKDKDSIFSGNTILYVVFSQTSAPELFDTFNELCNNIVNLVYEQSSEEKAVRAFVNQIIRWGKLLQKGNELRLSDSQQQGLFGELLFLQEFINSKALPKGDIVSSWYGPDGSIQDFQGNNWAVEVKTTSTSNPEILKINGERQLDQSLMPNLYLCHVSLQKNPSIGNTLSGIVDSVASLLSDDLSSLYLYRSKLNQVGYFEKDASKYPVKYKLRSLQIYEIKSDFPRIEEHELREGVGNVTYGISISNCERYKVPKISLFQKIKNS